MLSWGAQTDGVRTVTSGCFGFELGGYTDELASTLFDRIVPFAVRAAGGAGAAGLTRNAWEAHGFERRQALEFHTPRGVPAHGVLAFGFADGELQACFSVCVGPAPCADAVAAAVFATPREPLPSPSLGQSLALGALAHPRPVALGFVVVIALVIAALLFTRGARAT